MSLYTLTVDLLLKTGSFEKDGGKAARQFEQRMQSMQASAKRAGTVIGTAIAGGIIAGGGAVVGWTKQVSDLSTEYDRLSKIAGTSSTDFQRMAAGANTVGIANDKLADILKDVQDKIGDYVQTGGGAMADFFDNIAKRTGVTAEQMRKLSGPDALGLYFNSLEKANLSQSEMTFYMEAIASDASALMPLLKNGSAGFKAWGDAAETAGAIIDGKASASTARLRKITQEADLAFKGLKVSVAEEALPALSDLSEVLNDPDFRQGFGMVVKSIAEITAQIARFATTTAQVANWAGEELAARFVGPAADDITRVEERIGRLNSTIKAVQDANKTFGLSVFSSQELIPSDFVSSRAEVIKRLQGEVAREQEKLLLAADLRAMAGNAPSVAAPDFDGDRLGYQSTGNIDKVAREKSAAEAKRQADEVARYRKEAELAAGAMAGPLDEAMARHLQNMAEYNGLLAAGNIAQGDANVLMAQSALEYTKAVEAADKAMAGPEALLASMDGELALLGRLGPARELYRRQLMNERDMRDELQKAVEAAGSKEALALAKGVDSYEQYERAMLDAAAASAELSIQMEQAAANVEAWANVAIYGINDAADAMADFVGSGLNDWTGLWDDMKDVAKQALRDIARELLQQKLVLPIQTQILNSLSGVGGQGGGMSLQSIMGLFGGNGSAAGGQSMTNVAGLLSQGRGLFSSVGGASSAAGAGSLLGFGNNMAAFTGGTTAVAGGTAATGAAGAATGALGAVAAFAPYAALIAMGMQMATDAYGEGFGLEHQNEWGLLNRGHFASGGLLTPVMVDSMVIDKTLQAFGVSGKTAALISGSSLMGKAFGRSAPKITGQGMTGTYGFGGLEGQSYADVKQKGGWFRSDKHWTQYGTLDPGIDRTFDMAARQIRGATTGLADQLGVDLSAQLAKVNISLGKLKLSADSAEAQQQLEAYLADMQDRLWTEAVKSAGFGGQLDGYFDSVDVFAALSASIELAVGNADSLGRAMNSLEISKVNEAVDYFQDLASVAGTDLATQIEKVTGLLGNYSTLMADVSTQLLTADLSSYQQQALTVERTYRQQVASANEYAKALGLSGARAEDLAKIEALRASGMGKLQAQIDADKKAMTYGLSISDLSTLTDREKLDKTMQELQRAVAGGDSSAAQSAAQAALGFGRNLFASGQDYNSLYGQVTGLIDGMQVGDLNTADGMSMGELADVIEALPDNFSRAVFDLVVDKDGQAATTAAVQQSNALLTDVRNLLQSISHSTASSASTSRSADLRNSLNAK